MRRSRSRCQWCLLCRIIWKNSIGWFNICLYICMYGRTCGGHCRRLFDIKYGVSGAAVARSWGDKVVAWMHDQWHRTHFHAMVQIAKSSYIGEEVVTESLNQRFQRLSQRIWDPVARKASYLSASECHTTFQALLEETADMDVATIAQQVPELDAAFYRGLLPQLKDKPALAVMFNKCC